MAVALHVLFQHLFNMLAPTGVERERVSTGTSPYWFQQSDQSSVCLFVFKVSNRSKADRGMEREKRSQAYFMYLVLREDVNQSYGHLATPWRQSGTGTIHLRGTSQAPFTSMEHHQAPFTSIEHHQAPFTFVEHHKCMSENIDYLILLLPLYLLSQSYGHLATPWRESGTGTIHLRGTLSATIHLHGASSGTTHLHGTLSVPIHLHGTSSATIHLHGTSSGTIHLHGTLSGTIHLHGTSSGTIHLHGTSSGTIHLLGTSSGTIHLHGTSSGAIQLHGTSSGTIHLHGTQSGTIHLHGTSSGTIHFHGHSSVYYSLMSVAHKIHFS
ncbi:unnamed protein product [Coregonus sp. 'balchen']|nr:unnamed protein product [Coregonus sp. 'balchen']